MLFVKVPKEIKEYEEKVFLGLSLRQLLWSVLALVLGVVSYFLFSLILGRDLASYLVMLVVIPCFACGWIRVQDMPFDKFFIIMFHYYMRKQILVYENFIGWIETFDSKEVSDVSKKEKRRKRKATKRIQENQ